MKNASIVFEGNDFNWPSHSQKCSHKLKLIPQPRR